MNEKVLRTSGSMERAIVCAYSLPNDVKIEAVPQADESVLWAVRRYGACLNKESMWEYEPSPSSRDEDFLSRCRWSTPEAAYEAWVISGSTEE